MDIATKLTSERFAEGMTIEQFVDGMQKNKELFEERYESFTLKGEDETVLRELGRHLKVIVLAEDWCGDVVRYIPVFARMAEAAEIWDVRVFCRDQNLDLADMWLKHGEFRSIPVIVLFDEDLREVGCFVEKPVAVYSDDSNGRDLFVSMHPELADAARPLGEMGPDTYNLYVEFIKAYRVQHTERWQQMFVDEIMGKLVGIK